MRTQVQTLRRNPTSANALLKYALAAYDRDDIDLVTLPTQDAINQMDSGDTLRDFIVMELREGIIPASFDDQGLQAIALLQTAIDDLERAKTGIYDLLTSKEKK
jgi:hypothetical protein